jgi:hypothetical protein
VCGGVWWCVVVCGGVWWCGGVVVCGVWCVVWWCVVRGANSMLFPFQKFGNCIYK